MIKNIRAGAVSVVLLLCVSSWNAIAGQTTVAVPTTVGDTQITFTYDSFLGPPQVVLPYLGGQGGATFQSSVSTDVLSSASFAFDLSSDTLPILAFIFQPMLVASLPLPAGQRIPDGAIRFSYPKITETLLVIDVDNGTTLLDETITFAGSSWFDFIRGGGWGLQTNFQPFPPLDSQAIRVTGSIQWTPGNLLLPSDDALCASITCMTPIQDSLSFNGYTIAVQVPGLTTVVQIPEPQTYALMLIGLVALVAVRRRSRLS